MGLQMVAMSLEKPLDFSRIVFFLYNNHFYKNIEAEIFPQIKKNVWAKIRTSSGSDKFYTFLLKKEQCTY